MQTILRLSSKYSGSSMRLGLVALGFLGLLAVVAHPKAIISIFSSSKYQSSIEKLSEVIKQKVPN